MIQIVITAALGALFGTLGARARQRIELRDAVGSTQPPA